MEYTQEATLHFEGTEGEDIFASSGILTHWLQGVDHICTWKNDRYEVNTGSPEGGSAGNINIFF